MSVFAESSMSIEVTGTFGRCRLSGYVFSALTARVPSLGLPEKGFACSSTMVDNLNLAESSPRESISLGGLFGKVGDHPIGPGLLMRELLEGVECEIGVSGHWWAMNSPVAMQSGTLTCRGCWRAELRNPFWRIVPCVATKRQISGMDSGPSYNRLHEAPRLHARPAAPRHPRRRHGNHDAALQAHRSPVPWRALQGFSARCEEVCGRAVGPYLVLPE